MVAVETVIRRLISEYEFVIIPGFGALLSHQIPVSFDKDSGTFAPPVKKLAFNEFLKLDDGLLANFISREEKVSHTEAVTHVRQYTEVLRTSLQTDGQARIDGIGEFNTNTEGKLIFEPNTDNYFKDEWYGFKKVTARTFEKASAIGAPTINSAENDVEVMELHEVKRPDVNWIRWASAAMLAGLMLYVSLFLVNSNSGNKSTLNPFDTFKNESLPEKSVPKPVKKIEKVVKPLVDVEKRDSIEPLPLIESKAEIASAVAIPAVDTARRFYLIAGAFKGVRQAKVLLAELQSKGFDQALIIPSTRSSTKVKVAVGAFKSETDAYSPSGKLKTVIGDKGWVFKRK